MKILLLSFCGLLFYLNGNCQDNTPNNSIFNLHLKFIIPFSESAWPDSAVQAWIEPRIEFAEEVYSQSPALQLSFEVERLTQKGGVDLQALVFRSNRHFHKFMKKQFPIVAYDSISGYYPILVTEKFQVIRPQKRLCGKTFLPKKSFLFKKRHGMALKRYCASSVFAHEFGHIFHLKHTYQKGASAGCNKGFKKGKKGKRATADYENRTFNLMDSPIDGFKGILNSCQEEIAKKAREKYLNSTNHLNYNLFKKE